MIKQKKILVCPLNWGIGHATRVVPVVSELIRQGAEVHLAASGGSRAFLQEEFPDLTMHEFPGYEVTYPSAGSGMAWKILKQLPSLLRSVRDEHAYLDKMIDKHHIDGVISDNRYGLYSARVPAIFITHQLFIHTTGPLRFMQGSLDRMIQKYVDRFDECWIPDTAGEDNLSGDLSHRDPLPSHFHFIGPLSRFSGVSELKEDQPESEHQDRMLAILSGPEPQRTMLEEKLMKEFSRLHLHATLVRGRPGTSDHPPTTGHITLFNHLSSHELRHRMREAGVIICRPGYSSLMDLAALGCRAVLVPTPGQTEQEYLALYHGRLGNYLVMQQASLDLAEALETIKRYSGLRVTSMGEVLRERISNFLDRI